MAANTVPNPQAQIDQAAQAIYERVTGPAFFTKLASQGVVPEDDRQAAALFDIGRELLAMEQSGQLQQQSDTTAVLEKLAADLRGTAVSDEASLSLQQQILNDPELVHAAGVITAAMQQ